MGIDEDPAPDTGELNSGMTLGSPLGDVNGSRADVVRHCQVIRGEAAPKTSWRL